MGRGKTQDGVGEGRVGTAGGWGEKGTGGGRDGKKEDVGCRKGEGFRGGKMRREGNWRGKREDVGCRRKGEGWEGGKIRREGNWRGKILENERCRREYGRGGMGWWDLGRRVLGEIDGKREDAGMEMGK
jgi:hypothetical protein